jgi:hypothetical protein
MKRKSQEKGGENRGVCTAATNTAVKRRRCDPGNDVKARGQSGLGSATSAIACSL